jgi:hypothetical protein
MTAMIVELSVVMSISYGGGRSSKRRRIRELGRPLPSDLDLV